MELQHKAQTILSVHFSKLNSQGKAAPDTSFVVYMIPNIGAERTYVSVMKRLTSFGGT